MKKRFSEQQIIAILKEGESDVDESLMTGEAIPVLRSPGDPRR